MRISDWSSDVCSSDLREAAGVEAVLAVKAGQLAANLLGEILRLDRVGAVAAVDHQRLGAGRLGLRAVDAAVLEHAADHPVAPRHRGPNGSASGRESVVQYVENLGVAVSLNKKKKTTT